MRATIKLLSPLFAVLLTAACADTTPSSPAAGADAEARPEEAAATRPQPLVDQDGPNWFVAGADGLVELAGGEDGEPDEVVGRFALEGSPIFDASASADRLVVVGDGVLQVLDPDAQRLKPVRDVLGGQPVRLIIPHPDAGWLIAGGGGRTQLIDDQGEPTATEGQGLVGGATIVAIDHNGSWLLGTDTGAIAKATDASLTASSNSSTPFEAGSTIVGIAGQYSTTGQPSGWVVFSEGSYARVSAAGNAQTPVALDGVTLTEVTEADGKIALGTADGRVALLDPAAFSSGTVPAPSAWTDALAGRAVRTLTFDEAAGWLVAGDEGYAALLDAQGNVTTTAAPRTAGETIVDGQLVDGRWLLSVGELGMVAIVGADLSALRTLSPVLGGADILAVSVGEPGVLVAGAGGAYQLLDHLGQPLTEAQSAGSGDLFAASWNGTSFLVAGEGGHAQRVDASGEALGDTLTLLDGETIRFAAWSGEFWLVGGDGGAYQRVRSDGMAAEGPKLVEGASTLAAGGWSGEDWLVGGTNEAGRGIYALVAANGQIAAGPTVIERFPGTIQALDFNGIEWLVGGSHGLVQRVNGEGTLVLDPVDVLHGIDIHALQFNGKEYLVGGDHGAMRRLSDDVGPIRTPLALVGTATIFDAIWTQGRGFPSGPCLTNDVCFSGPCVGGITTGRCCDSACDTACESCFEQNTGKPDGTCAPVVAGKQPPVKEWLDTSPGCAAEAEATCGRTGVCDGSGACAYFGTDIECGAPICSNGVFTQTAYCTGTGACGQVEPMSCEPYANCTESGCADSCADDRECALGYVCQDGACVEETTDTPDGPTSGDEGGGDEGGCSAAGAGGSGRTPLALLLAAALLVGLRPRRPLSTRR